jgi:hypothetical protein
MGNSNCQFCCCDNEDAKIIDVSGGGICGEHAEKILTDLKNLAEMLSEVQGALYRLGEKEVSHTICGLLEK